MKRLLVLAGLLAGFNASAQPIQAGPGDYVEGELDSGAQRADLVLVDSQGRPLRQLLSASTGKAQFRFVVEPGMGPGLALRASAGAPQATLKIIKLAEQHAPAPSYRSPALSALAAELARGGDKAVALDAFWRRAAAAGTPLAEPLPGGRVLLSFVWRGAERNVRLFGGPSNDHEWMERLPGSDVWFKSFEVPASTRLSYQLAPDIPELPLDERSRRIAILATAQADPLNKKPRPADAVDRFARQSTVVLAQAPVQPGLDLAARTAGTLQRLRLRSERMGNEREITIYRPSGFDAKRADTVLLFCFDADEYLGAKVPTPAILDRLQEQGRLPQVVAVFVANPDRNSRGRELPGNPHFADFMAQELLPRVLKETGLTANAARTVLAGSSYGGLASATVALRHPERFGNVLAMSGSFWWSPVGTPSDKPHGVVNQVLAAETRLPLRFFLAAGLFETSRSGSDGILETNRHLRDVLQARGYPVQHREYAAGHDYLVWRGVLADGLLALFGKEPKQ